MPIPLSTRDFAKLAGLAAVTTLAVGQAAQADVITTYDRNAFQAAVAGGQISEQDFDGIPAGTALGSLDGVAYSASLGTPIVTDLYLTTTGDHSLGSTSAGYFEASETATFTFATAITAFAIDVNTYAPENGAYLATLNDGTQVSSLFEAFPSNSTGEFIGFTSGTSFTSVTISPEAAGGDPTYSYTLDTLVYGGAAAVVGGSSVPEPATFGLVGLGLLGLAVRRRRGNAA